MKKISDFLKRIKVKNSEEECKTIDTTNNDSSEEIQIKIENAIGLFADEEQKIREGAKIFLQTGKADNMEEAIINCAVMIRGLKFCRTQKDENGKTIIVLKETATIERKIGEER